MMNISACIRKSPFDRLFACPSQQIDLKIKLYKQCLNVYKTFIDHELLLKCLSSLFLKQATKVVPRDRASTQQRYQQLGANLQPPHITVGPARREGNWEAPSEMVSISQPLQSIVSFFYKCHGFGQLEIGPLVHCFYIIIIQNTFNMYLYCTFTSQFTKEWYVKQYMRAWYN